MDNENEEQETTHRRRTRIRPTGEGTPASETTDQSTRDPRIRFWTRTNWFTPPVGRRREIR